MSYYRMKLKNIMKSFIVSSITINSNGGGGGILVLII